MLLGSIFAQMFHTSFYKVKVSRISFETDTGTLSGLLYMPKGCLLYTSQSKQSRQRVAAQNDFDVFREIKLLFQ